MGKKLFIALATTLLSSTALAAGSYSSSTDSSASDSSHAGMAAQGSAHTGMSAGFPAFSILDTDKDGTLSKSEYDTGMHAHYSAMHSKTHGMDKSGMKDSSDTTTSGTESRSVTGASSDSSKSTTGVNADTSVSDRDSSVSGSSDTTARNPLTEQHIP